MKSARPVGYRNGRNQDRRTAILNAAREVFGERGYQRATTLQIAARAQTSKRALYLLFGSKDGIVQAMISERVREMRRPLELRTPESRAEFFVTLQQFGVSFLTQLLAQPTIALYRLAIAEAAQSPELGSALYHAGRLPVTRAISELFAKTVARGWVDFADTKEALSAYMHTLMGDVLMRCLLGAETPPRARELRHRAALAVAAVLRLDRKFTQGASETNLIERQWRGRTNQ
jgi:AcrR family transcriptional regulator